MMYSNIKDRVLEEANFFINNHSTVRATAKLFNISKSTVYKDLAERLWNISPSLARQVQIIFDQNIKERAYRGGNATREKYLKLKKCS